MEPGRTPAASAGRCSKARVKRSYYWESLDDALQGKTANALTASQLSRGRRYYSDGGARAVRLDDDTVHIEHRGIGRAQSSGVLPLHQLTPSRAPPSTTRLANITNAAPKGRASAPVTTTPEASPGLHRTRLLGAGVVTAHFFHASATVHRSAATRCDVLATTAHRSEYTHVGRTGREHARSAAGAARGGMSRAARSPRHGRARTHR